MTKRPARTSSAATRGVVERFNLAFNRHDVDAVMALSTPDTVLETTLPRPAGRRLRGQVAVRRYWNAFFASAPHARFRTEEIFASGDRCVVRWRFRWGVDRPGRPGYVRGVDVFRIRHGKIAEKLAYVKG